MSANRPFWSLLSNRNADADKATELYGRVVAQARAQTFYASLGAPDTPEGRLELLLLHMVLLLRRLQREGAACAGLGRGLTETFVTDMDDCMREMGVSDISVAKKVKKAAAALFDRARDYGAALASGDRARLAGLIARHVFEAGDAEPEPPGAVGLAGYALAAEAALSESSIDEVIAGAIQYPSPTH